MIWSLFYVYAFTNFLIEEDPVVPSLQEQARELRNLSSEFKEFKTECVTRRLQDSYRFAEIAENEDYKMNMANMNRVMVAGKILVLV
jgi:hypothetical protein